MRKERKHYTPEEKVSVLRRHLIDKVPVSTLCEEVQLRPRVFCHVSASRSYAKRKTIGIFKGQ